MGGRTTHDWPELGNVENGMNGRTRGQLKLVSYGTNVLNDWKRSIKLRS